jgi:hypothetical protein
VLKKADILTLTVAHIKTNNRATAKSKVISEEGYAVTSPTRSGQFTFQPPPPPGHFLSPPGQFYPPGQFRSPGQFYPPPPPPYHIQSQPPPSYPGQSMSQSYPPPANDMMAYSHWWNQNFGPSVASQQSGHSAGQQLPPRSPYLHPPSIDTKSAPSVSAMVPSPRPQAFYTPQSSGGGPAVVDAGEDDHGGQVSPKRTRGGRFKR